MHHHHKHIKHRSRQKDTALMDPGTPPTPPFPPPFFVKASQPDPADGAADVPIAGLELGWVGLEANLYLGTVSGTWTGSVIACYSPVDVAAQLGALLPSTTYYWQVNVIGGPPGDVWSFTTAP